MPQITHDLSTAQFSEADHLSMTKRQLFAEVLDELEPTASEMELFSKHRRIIEKTLRGTDVADIVPIGSRRRGTALAGFSDYDLLIIYRRKAVTRSGNLKSPDTALKRLRESICERYPFTDVRRDKQAIAVRFASTGCSIDLVPAYFAEPGSDFEPPARNYPVYGIPDGSGWWMPTSPPAYDSILKAADNSSGHKLRNVARLLKFWTQCYSPPTPLSSFACEVLLVNNDVCRPGRSYGHCVWCAFKLLAARESTRLADPLSLSEGIRVARTAQQCGVIRKRARQARILARRALHEPNAGESARLWAQVFNGRLGTR